MSLRDAIRDAVDERNKQSGNDAASANDEVANEAQSEGDQVELHTIKDTSTKARKPKAQEPMKQGKPPTPRPTVATTTTSAQKPDAASIKAVNTVSSKAVQGTSDEKNTSDDKTESIETAALTVRVPRTHRIHWLISAKKENTSLTAAITEALNARFGEPTD